MKANQLPFAYDCSIHETVANVESVADIAMCNIKKSVTFTLNGIRNRSRGLLAGVFLQFSLTSLV